MYLSISVIRDGGISNEGKSYRRVVFLPYWRVYDALRAGKPEYEGRNKKFRMVPGVPECSGVVPKSTEGFRRVSKVVRSPEHLRNTYGTLSERAARNTYGTLSEQGNREQEINI